MIPNQLRDETAFALGREGISVLIVDDHPVAADGLASYLGTADDIYVVGTQSHGEDAIEAAAHFKPNVVIIDLELNGARIDGIEAAKILRQDYPDMKLLALSAYSDQHHVLGAVSAGVDGYLIKTSSRVEIIQAIRTIVAGKTIFDPRVLEVIQLYIGEDNNFKSSDDQPVTEKLTDREWEVLACIAKNMSNREIAEMLYIDIKTVKTHVSNILKKVHVSDRNQARVWFHLHRRRQRN